MENMWVLKKDGTEEEDFFAPSDFDDYGYGPFHDTSIGDEIEAWDKDDPQFGIVLGIIRSYSGRPMCYKVWRQVQDEGDVGCFDYIQASKVTLSEPCGSSEWSLGRIGYKLMEDEDGDPICFYNEETGDVIEW